MNKPLSILIVATVLFYALSVMAANTVVVIPLNSTKRLNNIITVSKHGGDFTDPVAAVKSIPTTGTKAPGETNTYLVVIGPGVYTISETLIMKPYVSVVGSGQKVTTLTGAISLDFFDESAAIVSGADNSTLQDLSVLNTGGGPVSIALYNYNCSPVIQNVTATSSSGGGSNAGVYNRNSSPGMINVTVLASGGIVNNYGVNNYNASTPTLTNVSVTAYGGIFNYGIYNETGSSTIISLGTIFGTTNGLNVDEGAITVIQSSIIGGVTVASGTLTCIDSDNGVDKDLDINCLEVNP